MPESLKKRNPASTSVNFDRPKNRPILPPINFSSPEKKWTKQFCSGPKQKLETKENFSVTFFISKLLNEKILRGEKDLKCFLTIFWKFCSGNFFLINIFTFLCLWLTGYWLSLSVTSRASLKRLPLEKAWYRYRLSHTLPVVKTKC